MSEKELHEKLLSDFRQWSPLDYHYALGVLAGLRMADVQGGSIYNQILRQVQDYQLSDKRDSEND